MQLNAYKKDPYKYRQNFLSRALGQSNLDLSPYLKMGTLQELERLLRYCWEADKLKELSNRGVVIELFLGAKDQIINSQEVLEFFEPFVNASYVFKEAGHFLRIEK